MYVMRFTVASEAELGRVARVAKLELCEERQAAQHLGGKLGEYFTFMPGNNNNCYFPRSRPWNWTPNSRRQLNKLNCMRTKFRICIHGAACTCGAANRSRSCCSRRRRRQPLYKYQVRRSSSNTLPIISQFISPLSDQS